MQRFLLLTSKGLKVSRWSIDFWDIDSFDFVRPSWLSSCSSLCIERTFTFERINFLIVGLCKDSSAKKEMRKEESRNAARNKIILNLTLEFHSQGATLQRARMVK